MLFCMKVHILKIEPSEVLPLYGMLPLSTSEQYYLLFLRIFGNSTVLFEHFKYFIYKIFLFRLLKIKLEDLPKCHMIQF